MRPIPLNQREIIDQERDTFGSCILCSRHPEIDHVFLFARKQIAELWNYVPICTRHHRTGDMSKMSNSIIREAVELNCLLGEVYKNNLCTAHGVDYKPISWYNKTGFYTQHLKYLLGKREEINAYLSDHNLKNV